MNNMFKHYLSAILIVCFPLLGIAQTTPCTPVITSQSTDATICVGQSHTLQVSATSPNGSTLSYVWYKNGAVIANETTNQLAINSFSAAAADVYYVKVSNTCATADNFKNSNTITLSLKDKPTVSLVSSSASVCENTSYTINLNTNTNNGGLLTYKWKKGGVEIVGQTGSSFPLTNVQTSAAGLYSVEASNTCGATTSSIFQLSVTQKPIITSQPVAPSPVCVGGSFSLTAGVTGETSGKWFKNGTDIGVTSKTLTITNTATLDDAGVYKYVATNSCGDATTNEVTVVVKQLPTINSVTAPASACAGSNVTITAAASATGDNNFTYKWYLNNSLISTVNPLVVSNFQTTGTYSVEVTNSCGTTSSSSVNKNVTVQVVTPPTVASIATQQVCVNNTLTFTPVVTNLTGIPTYQWFKDNVAITGQTNLQLNIQNIQSNQAGSYYLSINNGCTPVYVSNTFAVQVLGAPVINTVTGPTQALCANGILSLSVDATNAQSYQWTKDNIDIAGANSSTYAPNNITTANAGVYRVRVSNSCGTSVTSNPITVTVNGLPTISTQPQATSVCVGQSTSFSVAATTNGGGTMTYQWKKGNALISGATSSTYTIASASASAADTYSVDISNGCGTIISSAVALTVNQKPAITAQPVTPSPVCVSGSFTLTAGVSGETSGRWKKDNVDIGITSKTLTINPVRLSDAGSYEYLAENTCGPVSTTAVQVVVTQAPTINALTAPTTACAGSTVTISASVNGNGDNNLSYQWLLNGTAIPNATGNTLTIPNIQSSGTYSLEVTNNCGTSSSSTVNKNVSIQVIPAPVIGTISNTSACVNTTLNVTPSVNNLSGNTISYQWYKGTTPVTGQTNLQLSLSNIQASQAGTYILKINNGCANEISSNAFTITVVDAPVINSVTAPTQAVCVGTSFNLSVDASNGQTYQWIKDNVDINGATTAQYNITVNSSAAAGVYKVRVSNTCGIAVISSGSTVSVSSTPTITTAPASATICVGQSTTFNVAANSNGGGTLSYQWKKDGVEIAGATANSYAISSAQNANAGAYVVEIRNNCSLNPIVSTSVSLTVTQKPTISVQPAAASVCVGSALSLSASALGSASVKWQKDNTDIGNTGNTVNVNTASLNDAGRYIYIATNACGSTSSNEALVEIKQKPTINSLTAPSLVCEGNNVTITPTVTGNGDNAISYVWLRNNVAISSETNSTLVVNNFRASNVGTYSVEATNGCGTSKSVDVNKTATIQIVAKPIIGSVTDKTACVNSSLSVSPNVSNTSGGTLTYKWFFNGSELSSQTALQLNLNNIQTSNSGTYYLVVNNGCGPESGPAFNVNVLQLPTITSISIPADVCVGLPLTLSVNATNTESYQWTKDNVDIPGATAAQYSIPAQTTNAGAYRVKLTNACGYSLTSNPGNVVVKDVPSIVSSPVSATVCVGLPASASVVANTNNGGTLRYTWSANNTAIVGATGATFNISSVALSDAKTYTVIVENTCGRANGGNYVLTVADKPSVTISTTIPTHPQANTPTVCLGSPINFNVQENTNGSSATYSWFKNDVSRGVQNTNAFSISNSQLTDAGSYKLQVTNACGVTNSNAITVGIHQRPDITTNPLTQTVCENTSLTLSGTAQNKSGTIAAISYGWLYNGNPYSGTSDKLTFSTLGTGNTGEYKLTASNECGTTVSTAAVLTVVSKPKANDLTAATQRSICNAPNQTRTLTMGISADNGSTPNITWSTNDGLIIGANNTTTLTVGPVGKSATYSARVYNACGDITKDVIVINEAALPSVRDFTQPPLTTFCENANMSIFVKTNSTGYEEYTWKRTNGTVVYSSQSDNQGNSTFDKSKVTVVDGGQYLVDIKNACGTVTSAASITVTINPTPIVDFEVTGAAKQCFSGNSFLFTNKPGNSAGNVSYTWDFGDGAKDLVSINTATHSYAATGEYTISLKGQNQYGCKGESTEKVTVIGQPRIDKQPEAKTVCEGTEYTLVADVNTGGADNITYQWYFNNQPISGTNSKSFKINSMTQSTQGSYYLKVLNAGCSLSTETVPVTVTYQATPRASFNTSTKPFEACLTNANYVFTNITPAIPGATYLWSISDGTTSNDLNLSHTFRNTGMYTVSLTATAGGCSSIYYLNNDANKKILINDVPVITKDLPSSLVVAKGDPISIDVIASSDNVAGGTLTVDYVWLKMPSTTNIGVNSNTYNSINAAQVSDSGRYYVNVSNTCGTVKSNVIKIRVDDKPIITMQPESKQSCVGKPLQLKVEGVSVDGNVPLYQWYYKKDANADPIALIGGNAPILNIPSFTVTDAGQYYVVLSNAIGETTSNVVLVSEDYLPQINYIQTSPSLENGVCVNSSLQLNASVTSISGSAYTLSWQLNGVAVTGQTGAQYTINSVSTIYNGEISLLATNACGTSTAKVDVKVIDIPGFEKNPQSVSSCLEGSVTFKAKLVTPDVNVPFAYQWVKNGSTYTGTGIGSADQLILNNVQVTDEGYYALRTSNICGIRTSESGQLTVIATAPVISQHPASVSSCVGTTQSLNTIASSDGSSLSYAWYKNGNVLADQIGSKIDFTSLKPGDAGAYRVVVTNACNLSTTSNLSQIVVKEKITLSQALVDRQICSGNELDIDIGNNLLGTEPSTSYRWKLNDVDINDPSAYTNRIRLASITEAKNGLYSITATNSCGSSTLNLFTLKVMSTPVITKQPLAASVCAGSNFNNAVEISNPDQMTISYQWYQDGVALTNAGSSVLSLQNIGNGNLGLYAVRVTNICGTTQSSSARLSLIGNPIINQNPQDITVCAGLDASTTVLATSDDNRLRYAWYKNDVLLSGQNLNKLNFSRISSTDAGLYKAIVTNSCNLSAISSVAAVFVKDKVAMINTIPDAERCTGTAYTIDMTNNLNNTEVGSLYQWKINGTDIVNATAMSRRLVISNLSSVHSGQYSLVASNSCGSTDIPVTKLAVVNLPTISGQPINTELCEKGAWITRVSLTNPNQLLSYQWYKDGTPLVNATSADLFINNLTTVNQGLYYVKISSVCGDVQSDRVTLSIKPRPKLTINLVNTPPVQCLDNNKFEFSADVRISDNSPVDLTWDFGDGVYSKRVSDAHSYRIADNFKVYLYGRSQNGCLDTTVQAITVNNRPTIINDLAAQTVCKDAQLNYTIDVRLLPNEVVAYQWYFNQALLPKETNKTITVNKFTEANKGFYSVRITNACGSNYSNEVKAELADKPLLLSSLPIDKKVCEGETIVLKPGVFSLMPVTYQWFKNDLPMPGKVLDSLAIRGFVLGDVAKYGVRVENICGTTLSPNGNLLIKNIPFTPQGVVTDTLCFATGRVLKIDPIRNNDDTLRISWYLNDRMIQSGINNQLALTNFNSFQTGLYKVVLSNSCGNVDVPIANLAVNRIRPGFKLDTLDACSEKLRITVTDTSKSFFPIAQNYWDIQETGVQLPGRASASYQFTTPGRFTIRHAVVDDRGCISDTMFTRTVNYERPHAAFSIVNNCLTTGSMPIDSSYFGIGSSKLVRYVWDYGDTVITTNRALMPNYIYKTPGTKQLKLTVSSDSSCVTDSLLKTFMVYGKPVAAFESKDSCQGFPVLFTNRSTTAFAPDSVTIYTWNFDDGTTSTLRDPQHIFKQYGAHNVRLTAISANCPNLTDDTLVNLSIKTPRANMTYPRVQGVKGVVGQLMAAPGGRSYSWIPFTGLSDSRIQKPTYKLSDSKVMYTITIVDSAGCVYKDQQEVWAFEKPDIYIATGFSPNNDGINDTYIPEYIQIKYLEYFRIADKNNRQIFITNDMKTRWDGTYQGTPLPPDPFVVTVSGIDINGNRITKQGIVVLVR